jgi:Reverse transcriptase (RNA-dependent DNA polymerase)
LDLAEERRVLNIEEFGLRIALKEHVYILTRDIEIKWKQRSRCAWLKAGYNNTKYFHAVANTRHNKNVSLRLTRMDDSCCTEAEMHDIAFNYFRGILGSEQQINVPFDITGRVGPCFANLLSGLDAPITEQEVHSAICSMLFGKSSGPDRYPAEFYKKFWGIIKADIMILVEVVHLQRVNISCLNMSKIMLIPKKEGASKINEYRPISMINTMIKIITKVYAMRLQPILPKIISSWQTTFVKSRSIMETFVATRELLHSYKRKKVSVVLLKVDFEKTFDDVNWSYSINLLIEKGFPSRWISTVLSLLKTSSSSIIINSNTQYFQHQRGLRQGDLLPTFIHHSRRLIAVLYKECNSNVL